MTVAELEARISSRELSEWMCYDQLEPFGHRIGHRLMAQLAALFYNANRGDNAAQSVDDFMPVYERDEDLEEANMAIFMSWAKQYGSSGDTRNQADR